MGRVVQDGVGGGGPLGRSGSAFAGVEIAIEARKVAAGDFQADAVAGAEDVTGGPEVDREMTYLAGRERCGRQLRVAIFGAKDAFGEIDGGAVWKNVNEFCGEIGVNDGRGCEEFEADGPGYFEVVLKGRGGVDQNVVAVFDGALVARARREMIGVAAERAADGGNGLGRIVSERVGGLGSRSESRERAVAVR
jgi:hypothetical protein